MNDPKEFMRKLHEQVELANPKKTKEEKDDEICDRVWSWVENATEEYNRITGDGVTTDGMYMGKKLAKAGVDYQKALDFIKKKLRPWYGPYAMNTLETEVRHAYHNNVADLKWRKKTFGE